MVARPSRFRLEFGVERGVAETWRLRQKRVKNAMGLENIFAAEKMLSDGTDDDERIVDQQQAGCRSKGSKGAQSLMICWRCWHERCWLQD